MEQTIRFADGTGHGTQVFDLVDMDQRSMAEQLFNAELAKGALIFSTDTTPGEHMLEYRPDVREIFVAYPMAGG